MKSCTDLAIEELERVCHRAQFIVSNAAADLFQHEATAAMAKERLKAAVDDLESIRRDLRAAQCAKSVKAELESKE